MKEGYILAHDLGTSGCKASLVGLNGEIAASHTAPYPLHSPRPGWAEQNPADWWAAFCECNRAVLKGIDPAGLHGVCLAGQMMCCLPVDENGAPLGPALLWADGRAEAQADVLCRILGEGEFYRLTGMRPSAQYGLPKMMWLRDNKPGVYRRTHRFLGPKDYINHRLTGRFATDPESAAFLHCYDWRRQGWSPTLLDAAGMDIGKLPEILAPGTPIGTVESAAAAGCGLPSGLPVVMGPGDGGAATLGSAVLAQGEGYISLGTSSWVSVVTGSERLDPLRRTAKLNYLGTLRDSGTMQAGGYAYAWMQRTLCEPERVGPGPFNRLVDDFAASAPPGANGTLFLPYLMGERAPLWSNAARAAFVGMTGATTRADLCRAVMEGVALHLRWIYDCISETNGLTPGRALKLVGGGAKSPVWGAILADVLGLPLQITARPDQAGALGTAVAAGVGLGLYQGYEVLRTFQPVARQIEPNAANRELYVGLYQVFRHTADALGQTNRMLEAWQRGNAAPHP